MIALTVKILLAYALGSVSGSLIIGRLRHVDIRQHGSGNAGGTNALRTQGFLFALGVVVIDVGKGALAAGFIPGLPLPGLGDPVAASVQAVACGAAAVFGHCYPVWHGFRGGKGAATAVGTLCVLQPLAIAPMLGVWLLVLILSGWVGLATMFAAISLVPAMLWLDAPGAHLAYTVFLAAFLVFTHRGNIRNMRAGTEHRFQRAMLRNWFR
ncbi:glycerol-3-phosphate 1-O-acyltransferase PlsY [Elongatibacter sediminis]|uniref:Glycerol-3-phosphate acyltransferase n=1 Tax=Elongatibacter sediminis TaxID=3119006 RepID=A0AAW9RNS4_9GAMM